ncbi:hypothetical protein C1646_758523 [Rhizophagus diaphanus]|nr:hypothetical protein C1646_758523 [Rhizophagus diaphanus] [Rhizophagus sp. MUCL 43196]
MLSIHIDNPPIHSDVPTDITPSLDYNKELGTTDEMSIRNLIIKTAILLAIVTASRPSDLKKLPHTPAATDTIANWIKSVNVGGDLATILALGNLSRLF